MKRHRYALRLAIHLFFFADAFSITNVRPPAEKRNFTSSLVNFVVDQLNSSLLPQPLGTLFANCFPNTLDTTVLHVASRPGTFGETWDSFVVTGDIPAMWLRDSMNQVLPYVRVLNTSRAAGKRDTVLENFLLGIVHRQASSILIDQYTNAFAWWGPNGKTDQNPKDKTFKEFEYGAGQVNAMQDRRIFERKFELDSLLSVLRLASNLEEALPAGSAAKLFLQDAAFIPAVSKILATMKEMQSCSSNTYTFQRSAEEPTDTLSHGVGFPCQDTGMVRTHFRPSDDSVVYAFNIPANAMAVVELRQLMPLLHRMLQLYQTEPHSYPWAADLTSLGQQAEHLEASISAAIQGNGTMLFRGEKVYAYEVDGFGNAIFMDDANVPSLLSLPFLGYLPSSDPLYQATRRLLLSRSNPWYFKGTLDIGGIGGPHVGAGHIWPMSLMIQAWTSDDVDEVAKLFKQLIETSRPNSLMHESFNKDNLKDFSRPWFAWANTLFGDLVLKIATDPVLYRAINLTKPLDLVSLLKQWTPPPPQPRKFLGLRVEI